ncbi:carbohydrate ABC transporter permease [Streptacidiphilus sp. PB12-B1b]|uniref:carbohydrate ABC transporter permease n=1 Tax=Streptacidiphilus sp. PB12-B1b TaxID=2705012 RepID=UPI0015FA1AF5|nr:carbohydrate ABC transporter permease [Streptacidiphilus sp. PB12-B1b]QMU77616.1 carbohydrate ABC transporter permease [Streptacidiphilus sp. PB12-B1b]
MAAVDTQTRTLISQSQLSRPRARVVYWVVLWALVALFALVFLFPLYWMFSSGLKTAAEVLQSPPSLVPAHPQAANYRHAWSDLDLGRFMLNTLMYAGGALAFQLVFDVSAAYALSKLRPVLGNVVLFMMLSTLMIPAMVLIIPQYLTALDVPFVHWDLLNTPWAIWLPSVANGFNIFILKRFFDSVPQDLLSAATIDGAGPLRTLWSVILPMSRPIIGVVSIFAVVNVWKDFLWPYLVLTDTSKMSINVGLYSLSGDGIPENVFMAALAMACVPTIVFFLIFQRNIMSGLTAGSLKG